MSVTIYPLMKNCLKLISLTLLFLPLPIICWGENAVDSTEISKTNEYNLFIQFKKNDLSAIFIVNEYLNGDKYGTVVNEFGVKVFDLVYSNNRTKIINVLGPLDKWYIRRVLRKDFDFFLFYMNGKSDVIEKKRRFRCQPNGDIVVENSKYKIRYTFTPMINNL